MEVFMATVTSTPLLNEKQAAELLGTTPGTLAVWRCTRRYPELRYIKIGRSVRYSVEDLQDFISRRTIGAAGESLPATA